MISLDAYRKGAPTTRVPVPIAGTSRWFIYDDVFCWCLLYVTLRQEAAAQFYT